MVEKINPRGDTPSTESINSSISEVIEMNCCLQRTDSLRGLILGFGKKTLHKHPQLAKAGIYRGEWEFRAYTTSWRVTLNGKILCGNRDLCGSTEELNESINKIRFTKFERIGMTSPLDLYILLSGGMKVDYLCTSSNVNEVLEIVGPSNFAATYYSALGWKVGRSDLPWNSTAGRKSETPSDNSEAK
jgi:hypothetical protein